MRMSKKIIVVAFIITAIVASILLLHRSTTVQEYKEYPPTFQQRGDVLPQDRFPKNSSDSMFLLQMEQLQFKDEIRNELTSNNIDWNGVIASICLLSGAFVGIMGLFFKWINSKRETDIIELKSIVIENHTQNLEQHNKIFKILEVVEDITIRKDIYESIRCIARNYMHYQKGSIPDNLQALITAQAERIIALSEQVMNEKFSLDVYDVIVVKIDEQSRIAWKQVAELFGCDFLVMYKSGQKEAVHSFKMRLKAIVNDTEFNSKYDRYRRASEMFLDELIQITLAKYKEFKKL